jgi:hypothetical protein
MAGVPNPSSYEFLASPVLAEENAIVSHPTEGLRRERPLCWLWYSGGARQRERD